MSDKLFTFVCEFVGGTYISQVRADDERGAVIQWGTMIGIDRPMGEGSDRIACHALGDDDPPVTLDGLIGVWCWTKLIDDHLVVTNIIRSA